MTRNRDPETSTTVHSPYILTEMTSSKLIQTCTTIYTKNPFNYQLMFMTNRKGYLCRVFQQIKIIQSFKIVCFHASIYVVVCDRSSCRTRVFYSKGNFERIILCSCKAITLICCRILCFMLGFCYNLIFSTFLQTQGCIYKFPRTKVR